MITPCSPKKKDFPKSLWHISFPHLVPQVRISTKMALKVCSPDLMIPSDYTQLNAFLIDAGELKWWDLDVVFCTIFASHLHHLHG